MATSSYIYDGIRTPFGRFGKSLAGVRPDDLERRGGGIGVAALCIGVGQGLAVVLER